MISDCDPEKTVAEISVCLLGPFEVIRIYFGYVSVYLILIAIAFTSTAQSPFDLANIGDLKWIAVFVVFALYWPFASVSAKLKTILRFSEEREIVNKWYGFGVGLLIGLVSLVLVYGVGKYVTDYWGLATFVVSPIFILPTLEFLLRRKLRENNLEKEFSEFLSKHR